jgi:mannose-6-phosphate isomerase-like protein (cupin superfamily)
LFECVSGNSSIDGAVHHRAGSVFRVLAGQMLLMGGGSLETGATLDAPGGTIYLHDGTHTWTGGTITGNRHVYCSNTSYTTVSGEVGAATGAATGGFGVTGGTLTGTGMISADHGYFSTGLIGGSVTIRLTGNSTTGSATTLNMNGGTILNEGVWTNAATGTINLDSSSGGSAGTIINKGTWKLDGAVSYNNTNNAGQLVNHGVFECLTGNSSIDAALHHRAGSVFRVSLGQMLLSGGGSLETGATLDASGGTLYLSGGTHTWTGGTLIGNRHVYCSGGTTTVSGEVGAPSGAATGGFGVTSGTLTGTGMVSADHGYFSTGLIGGSVTIRLTGNSTTGSGTTLNMNGGTILNEGVWTNAATGAINLDSSTGGSAGTIVNRGIWRLNGAVGYSNTYGGGQVENHGLFECVIGNSSIDAAVHHRTGSVFRVLAGQMLLTGGGSLEAGATLDVAGGTIYLYDGTHTLTGGTITGNSYVYCSSNVISRFPEKSARQAVRPPAASG